jgi:polyisoprenoid-binding protein YceI
LADTAQFVTWFNHFQGEPRLLLFLSPGCPSCLAGARWLEQQVLAPAPELGVRVFALWFPSVSSEMLPPESGRWDESLLQDPRVVHVWDGEHQLNEILAASVDLEGPTRASLGRTFGGLSWGRNLWDVYLLYGPEASWDEQPPAPAAAAYPVLQNREALRQALAADAPPPLADTGSTRFRIVPEASLVSYGVQETLAGRTLNYAIGVTNQVSGTINLDVENPAASQVSPITVNIQSFDSDNFLRDERIQWQFLESARFPIATFTATELRGLPNTYRPGETVEFEMVGELLVRETTVPVVFAVTAALVDGRLTGTAITQVRMSDFGFDPPRVANLIATENEVDITFDFVAEPVS